MPIDPYLYPGTEILQNHFGIKDEQNLKEMEAEFTSLRLSQIAENPLTGNYDTAHACEMHRFIFSDIFGWAGKFRTIDIEKAEFVLGGISIEYTHHKEIESALTQTLNDMKSESWLNYSLEQQAEKFSRHISKVWRIHPFREGNTRTITHFCCQYADSIGMYIDRRVFEDNIRYFRSALVAACAVFKDLGDRSKPEYLNKIVMDALQKGHMLK